MMDSFTRHHELQKIVKRELYIAKSVSASQIIQIHIRGNGRGEVLSGLQV